MGADRRRGRADYTKAAGREKRKNKFDFRFAAEGFEFKNPHARENSRNSNIYFLQLIRGKRCMP
jgi:hypothetical protein